MVKYTYTILQLVNLDEFIIKWNKKYQGKENDKK